MFDSLASFGWNGNKNLGSCLQVIGIRNSVGVLDVTNGGSMLLRNATEGIARHDFVTDSLFGEIVGKHCGNRSCCGNGGGLGCLNLRCAGNALNGSVKPAGDKGQQFIELFLDVGLCAFPLDLHCRCDGGIHPGLLFCGACGGYDCPEPGILGFEVVNFESQ